jgi:hypothetical protein
VPIFLTLMHILNQVFDAFTLGKPFLSEWVQTLMFRRLKQRKFVKIDQSDKRGVILTEFRNTFSTVYEVSKEETRLGLIWA